MRHGLGPHSRVEGGHFRHLGESDGAGTSGKNGSWPVITKSWKSRRELWKEGRRERGEKGKRGEGRMERGERRAKKRRQSAANGVEIVIPTREILNNTPILTTVCCSCCSCKKESLVNSVFNLLPEHRQ